MNTDEAAAYSCAGDWTAIEARYQRAKQSLLETQQRHCDAAQEFLLARAQVRQMLEMVFPGGDADSSQPFQRRPAAVIRLPRSTKRACPRHTPQKLQQGNTAWVQDPKTLPIHQDSSAGVVTHQGPCPIQTQEYQNDDQN